MADEYIDQLTPEGVPTGIKILKSEAHRLGLWHASVHVWIATPKGKVLLQKRASNKDTYPNLWDISVAGHLSFGDVPTQAALREVQEEIGMELSTDQLHHFMSLRRSKTPTSTILDNEFHYVYRVVLPISQDDLKSFELQTEEVAELRLLSFADFEKALENSPEDFVPHGLEYYKAVLMELIRKGGF